MLRYSCVLKSLCFDNHVATPRCFVTLVFRHLNISSALWFDTRIFRHPSVSTPIFRHPLFRHPFVTTPCILISYVQNHFFPDSPIFLFPLLSDGFFTPMFWNPIFPTLYIFINYGEHPMHERPRYFYTHVGCIAVCMTEQLGVGT